MNPLIQEIRKSAAASRQIVKADGTVGGIPFAKLEPSLQSPVNVVGGVRGPAPVAQAAAIAWMLENENRMPIFPKVVSDKQSGEYREWPKNSLHYVEAQKRAIGTEARNIEDAPVFKPYSTEMYALQYAVYDKIVANQHAQVDSVQRAGVDLAEGMARTMIKAWIDVALKADAWDFRAGGVVAKNTSFDDASAANPQFTRWDVYSKTNDIYDSNPVRDVRRARLNIMERTGYTPNVLYITPDTYEVLIEHPGLIARVNMGQTSGAAQPTLEQIGGLMDTEIRIIKSIARSTFEGNSQFLAKKQALLGYIPETAVMDTPSAGYCFTWDMGLTMNETGAAVDQYRNDAVEGTYYRIQSAFEFKIVAKDLACYFSDIIS